MNLKTGAIALSVCMLTSCGTNIKSDRSKRQIPKPMPIVLINDYQNNAWGYQHNGVIIDNSGKSYYYDLSDKPQDITFKEEMACFEKTMSESDSESTGLDENDILDIQDQLSQIDETAGFTCNSIMADAGQTTLYAIKYTDNEPSKITIYSYGDTEQIPLDKHAYAIYQQCKDAGLIK